MARVSASPSGRRTSTSCGSRKRPIRRLETYETEDESMTNRKTWLYFIPYGLWLALFVIAPVGLIIINPSLTSVTPRGDWLRLFSAITSLDNFSSYGSDVFAVGAHQLRNIFSSLNAGFDPADDSAAWINVISRFTPSSTSSVQVDFVIVPNVHWHWHQQFCLPTPASFSWRPFRFRL